MKTFKQFLESTIGIENIRTKYYSQLTKREFYLCVNIDPTSVRKKGFSKMGKYSRWLLHQYINYPEYRFQYFQSEEGRKDLNKFLFIFSTGWYKNKGYNRDILKYKDIFKFILHMYKVEDLYEKETFEAKYDSIYEDDNVRIIVPLNFTASYETAKNTDWCSNSLAGFSQWNQSSILYRIMPKKNGYSRVKLTWSKVGDWYMASEKYPEINGKGIPFEKINYLDIENWQKVIRDHLNTTGNELDKAKDVFMEIERTMSLVSKDAKEAIMDHWEENIDDKDY